MAAYNRLHGTHCTRARPRCSPRSCATSGAGTAWSISDWFATRSTVGAATRRASTSRCPARRCTGARRSAAAHRAGRGRRRHDRGQARAARPPRQAHRRRPRGRPVPTARAARAEVRAVAREAAAAGAVLLRNEPVRRRARCCRLPADLRTRRRRRPARRPRGDPGRRAAPASRPTDVATIADGLRERARRRRVVVEPGCGASRGTPALDGRSLRRADGTAGVDVEILDADGVVRAAPAAPRLPGDVPRRPRPGRGDRRVDGAGLGHAHAAGHRAPTASR